MLKAAFFGALLTATLAIASPSAAQVTPIGPTQNAIRVVFTGTVTNDVTDQIRIRQPDGTSQLYTGPVPEYPYRRGDQVTISFDTVVPNRNFYSSPAYTGQVAADGIYRIRVNSPATGVSSGPGFTRVVDVSGPIQQEPFPLRLSGLTLVYDSNGDTYSLEFPTGSWLAATFDAPSYRYDANTGELISSPTACVGAVCEDAELLIRGNENSASISNGNRPGIPIGGLDSFGGPIIYGLLNALNLSGSFNFPTFGGGNGDGGPIDVPEPSMLLLFGGGAAMIVRRRRKKAAAA